MFSKLHLDRPLAVFDIEATGLNIRSDRVIELSIIRVAADWTEQTRTWLLNPTIPIPLESTAIHGITDADVAGCPTFLDVVDEIDAFLADCDLAGYNLIHFDIPILEEEFLRCGRDFRTPSRRILDAQRIFHAKEPRDLTAALKFFCGRDLGEDAHGAEADARATLEVIEGEFRKYGDLPATMDELDREFNPKDPSFVDRAGRIAWRDGEAIVNFGKKKGARLRELATNKEGQQFLRWMVKSDFPTDTRKICEDALRGVFPERGV
jgi:DNA polymerase-3 subunit epsilon